MKREGESLFGPGVFRFMHLTNMGRFYGRGEMKLALAELYAVGYYRNISECRTFLICEECRRLPHSFILLLLKHTAACNFEVELFSEMQCNSWRITQKRHTRTC